MFVSIVFVISVFSVSVSEKILCAFSIPSASHLAFNQAICNELSLRGHKITVLTPIPQNNASLTNLTEIEIPTINDIVQRYKDKAEKMSKDNYLILIILCFFKYYGELTEEVLIHVDKNFPEPTSNFDLVVVENLHPLIYSLGCRFKAPIVGITSTLMPVFGHDMLSNPSHPVLHFDFSRKLAGGVDFYEKLTSVAYNILMRITYYWYARPQMDKKSKKYFGTSCSRITDIQRNVSLVLVNASPILHLVRPNVPAIVELGGLLHIRPKQPLPQDLQSYLDQSTQGVIYFSLGSNIKSISLPNKTIEIIAQALSELPYNVLWKWENDKLSNQPKNVMTKKWMPQQDLLGHKHVKAYVMQGGRMSIEEAVVNCVPIVGMPFFLDQASNIRKLVNMGIAQSIDHCSMTKNSLKQIIIEVAENEQYRERIKKVRDLIQDRPMQGLDTAVSWIEFVLRNKGAPHLRSTAANISWCEYFQFDVVAVVSMVGGTIISLLICCKRQSRRI